MYLERERERKLVKKETMHDTQVPVKRYIIYRILSIGFQLFCATFLFEKHVKCLQRETIREKETKSEGERERQQMHIERRQQ